MSLPSSGLISLSAINVELGKAANAPISLNDPDVRALLAKPNGSISINDGYGKSKIVGNTFKTGNDTVYGGIGWNITNVDSVDIVGSASPSPIPMAPYSGNMLGIMLFNIYGLLTDIWGTGPATDIYATVNGIRYLFTYGGSNGMGLNYWNYANWINMHTDGVTPNTITFG